MACVLYLKDAIPSKISGKDPEKLKTRIVEMPNQAAADVIKLINKGYIFYTGSAGEIQGILSSNILAIYHTANEVPIEDRVGVTGTQGNVGDPGTQTVQ